MNEEIIKDQKNLFFSEHIRKYSCSFNVEDEILIPLRNKSSQERLMCEGEWNQEYYLIYNSYLLEEKD